MNIPLAVAKAQGHHGIKGAAHGLKGGRPPLVLTHEERTERRRAQQAAYRRRKGIPQRSRVKKTDTKYFAIWGKLPGEPLTPEEYAEREPFWNNHIQPGLEAAKQKQDRADERLEARLQHIEQYDAIDHDLIEQFLKLYRAPDPLGRHYREEWQRQRDENPENDTGEDYYDDDDDELLQLAVEREMMARFYRDMEIQDLISSALPALAVGRNQPCTCGSGKKFKKCCGK